MPAQVDFYSMLSGLGDQIATQRKAAARQAAFANVTGADGAVDFGKAILGLTQAGDIEGAARMQQLKTAAEDRARQAERDKINDAWRISQADREQRNADRSFGLQQRAANRADEDKPVFKEVTNADGSTALYRLMPRDPNAKATRVDIGPQGGGPVEQANPFAASGKQTEGQANAGLYAGRMFQSEKILRDPKIVNAATNPIQRAIDKAPLVGSSSISGIGNHVQGEDYQKFDQAQRDFINATLRRESGAVISPEEFDNARKQYFPRPGDSKELIAQKQRNRAEAIKGIAGAAGQAWRAPFTFDDAGNLQPRGNKPVAPSGSGVVDWQTYFGAPK